MFAALRVSKIGSVILMDRQAKTTFETADVVLEEIRVSVFVVVYY